MAEVKMVYESVDEMINELGRCADELNNVISVLTGVGDRIDGGALLGDSGDALSGGLRGTLIPSIRRLIDAIDEQKSYVTIEYNDMKEAEEQSAANFR